MSGRIVIVAVALAFTTITAPILLSIELARRGAISREKKQALAFAADAQRRSDAVADQVREATDRLDALHSEPPCGPEHVAAMRRVDLSSSYIQAVGHVSGTLLDCSSYGTVPGGVELGPVDFTTRGGVRVRRNVELPFAPGRRVLVLERRGYAAIIHKNLPLDVRSGDDAMAVAEFSPGESVPLTAQGSVDPAWAASLFANGTRAYVDGDYVVAAVRSRRYDTGAVVALPATRVSEQTRAFALVMVPIGCVAGLLLALAALRLMRVQTAMPAVIKSALKRNEFFLVYQPVVDLRSGAWIGAEALIRWRRPSGEMVRPDVFIAVAEEAGLIQRVTEKVIEIVGREAPELVRTRPGFHVAINLSAKDFESHESVVRIRELARRPGLDASNLIVEATERGFLRVDVAKGIVKELRDESFRVAIDDFGTGYSSLAYLQTFDIDYLKIDKSFVDTIGTEAATSHVVQHIILMAKSLGLEMIAEGVETEAQAAFLRDRGVQYAQGWLFARPLPFEELLSRLTVEQRSSSAPRPSAVDGRHARASAPLD